MHKLIETKIQKIILLVGGILIFIRLYSIGSYYETYKVVSQSFAIAIIIIILLTLLRDVNASELAKITLLFIRRYAKIWIPVLILITVSTFLCIDNWKENCANNLISQMASKIDPNAYITDTTDFDLIIISNIYGMGLNDLINIKKDDTNKILKQNVSDLMYMAYHPQWRTDNLTKINSLISNKKISDKYKKELEKSKSCSIFNKQETYNRFDPK